MSNRIPRLKKAKSKAPVFAEEIASKGEAIRQKTVAASLLVVFIVILEAAP